MPIYAYRCASCSYENDHLQKMSDAELSLCPQCGQGTYRKQLTAAGFQLKGSGWYATDFKGDRKRPPAAADKAEKADKADQADTPAKSEESAKSGAAAASGKAGGAGSTTQAEGKAAACGAGACAVH